MTDELISVVKAAANQSVELAEELLDKCATTIESLLRFFASLTLLPTPSTFPHLISLAPFRALSLRHTSFAAIRCVARVVAILEDLGLPADALAQARTHTPVQWIVHVIDAVHLKRFMSILSWNYAAPSWLRRAANRAATALARQSKCVLFCT